MFLIVVIILLLLFYFVFRLNTKKKATDKNEVNADAVPSETTLHDNPSYESYEENSTAKPSVNDGTEYTYIASAVTNTFDEENDLMQRE